MPGPREDLRVTVRILRAMRGWNQREFAAASGMDKSRISHYEQGQRVPSRKTLERLAEAAGVPPAHLDEVLVLIRRLRHVAEGRSPHDAPADADTIARSVADAVQAKVAEILRDFDWGSSDEE